MDGKMASNLFGGRVRVQTPRLISYCYKIHKMHENTPKISENSLILNPFRVLPDFPMSLEKRYGEKVNVMNFEGGWSAGGDTSDGY